jgi:ABC-2 type transport system ATP-binding protein
MELIIKNLSKTYSNGVKALNDISLTVPQGMFGLLGPNGAGKSTLMRTIATLQDADFGTVMMDGIDVLKDKQAVRERLGYLPQDFGLYPRINAETMLDHIAQMKVVLNNSKTMSRKFFERLQRIDGLIRLKGTGNSTQFANNPEF